MNSHQPTRADKFDRALRQWSDFPSWLRTEGVRRLQQRRRIYVACAVVGTALAFAVPLPLHEVAVSVAASYGSLLVGITFAWSVTIATILQTAEARELGIAQKDRKTFRNWVMNYQFTLVTIFSVILLWALIGARIGYWPARVTPRALHYVGRAVVFAVTAFMLTEMYDAIRRVQTLLLTVEFMRRIIEGAVTDENLSEYLDEEQRPADTRVEAPSTPQQLQSDPAELEQDADEHTDVKNRR